MNVFRKQNFISVVFSDGQEFTSTDCTDSLWENIKANINSEEALKTLLLSDNDGYKSYRINDLLKDSSILTKRGNSVYMLSVSEISIPEDFVLKILEAEANGDYKEVNKYKNFWTLVSLNPDCRVRDNIFWFIRKWDMQISDSGLIIAYRNANIKKEGKYSTEETKWIINCYYQCKYIDKDNPALIEYNEYGDGELIKHKEKGSYKTLEDVYNEIVNGEASPIYTDNHSGTTTIILGKPVSIPRTQCDDNQDVSCSRGLHLGAKSWLKKGYFGDVGIQALVNPAKIVAVPRLDDYGKLRCCEYFPVALIDFDDSGDIIEKPYSLYNDVAYLKKLKYDGDINNDDINHYQISAHYNSSEDLYDSILEGLRNQ